MSNSNYELKKFSVDLNMKIITKELLEDALNDCYDEEIDMDSTRLNILESDIKILSKYLYNGSKAVISAFCNITRQLHERGIK